MLSNSCLAVLSILFFLWFLPLVIFMLLCRFLVIGLIILQRSCSWDLDFGPWKRLYLKEGEDLLSPKSTWLYISNEHQLSSELGFLYSIVMNLFDGQGIRGIGWSWSSIGWFFTFIWFPMLNQLLSSWQHLSIVIIRTKIGRLKMELQKIAKR